jgi:PAS domain S-box-containing protein
VLLSPDDRSAAAEHLAIASAYQDQLCDLELANTRLRARVVELEWNLAEARAARGRFADLFDDAPISYLVLDDRGCIQELNRAAAALLGLKVPQATGMLFCSFMPRDELPRFLGHMRECQMVRRQAVTELPLTSAKRRSFVARLITTPVQISVIEPIRCFRVMLLDTTEQRAAELALNLAQQDYKRLVDAVEGIVWEADARTLTVRLVGRYAERLLGYPIQQWMQPGFWENHIHVEDRDRVTNTIARSLAHHRDMVLEYRVFAADRRVLWIHDTVTLVDQGGRLKLLGVAVDITARKESEVALRHAHNELELQVLERTRQLREAVGQLEAFSYSLAHDMRAPLRAMQGYSEVVLATLGPQLGPTGQDYLRRVMSSAERLDTLIQDVLRYSRVSRAPVELKPVDLEKLVDTIVQDYPALQAPQAEVEVRRPLLAVWAHEAFLSQCVSNLLTNAVKFARPGVTPHVRIWTEAADDNVQLWVEDNGIGIAPEDQHRIFGIFQRVNSQEQYEGTGIGLAIAQKAIERIGGQVGVESQLGHGSRFWLQLQRAPG